MKKQAGKAANPTTIRIHCLGHFHVEVDGGPLDESAQAQRKPLALLKTLIALGGDQVPEDQVSEALWPDSDGDAAQQAFRTTLYRLRQVFGAEAVRLRQGRLSLGAVWCDVRELLPLLERAEAAIGESDASGAGAAMENALALYRGPFLEGEFEPPEILVARDRLHSRVLRALREAAGLLERNGERDAAIRLYQKGAEADPTAEELVQPLMQLLHREGRAAEAEAVYQRLRRNLEAQGGIAPSAESEAVRGAINPQLPERRREATTRREESTVPPAPALVQAVVPHGGEVHSLAVLPLTNMSGDPALDYFSDGLAEDLITDLSQYAQFGVVARNSSFKFRGRQVDVRDVGRDLGVRYVLEGSVRASDRRDSIRINFQLADTTTGHHIWAERFDRSLRDVFGLQNDIVDEVALAIDMKLAEGPQMAGRRRSTRSYEAYVLFRRANGAYRKLTRGDTLEAAQLLRRAVEIDSQFAAAWAALGFAHQNLAVNRWTDSPQREFECAWSCAQTALEADPILPGAHMLASHLSVHRRNHDLAVRSATRAVELDPAGSDGHAMLGLALLWAGSPEAGIASLQRGVELAKVPIDWMEANIGLGYLMLKRYDEAIEYLEGAARKAPKWGYCCLLLAFAYAESGDIAKAQNQWKKVLSLDPAISLRRPRPMMNWANDQEFSRRMVAALRSAGLK